MEEIKYTLSVDNNRNELDGGRNYVFRMPSNLLHCKFWSILVYDAQTHLMVYTSQPWPSVHKQTKALNVDRNDNVTVYFGPTAPHGNQQNWIKTIPGKQWKLVFNLYEPIRNDSELTLTFEGIEELEIN